MEEKEIKKDVEKQIVYILTNQAYPNYIKIGKTSNLKQRLKSLDSTGVPLPFECYFAVEVDNMSKVERLLHQSFDKYRVRKNREFFELLPENAKSALELANGKDITPKNDIVESADDQKALDKARRKRFSFSLLNIQAGTELAFSKDENQKCKVIDDRLVEFRDEEMTLSGSALIIINEMGYDWSQIHGPAYWEYENQSLHKLRLDLEI